jgi:serine/threonine protein kinase
MKAQLPPDPPAPEYGSLVGSWIVKERIGQGSHGLVFLAVHADRPEAGSYALKLAKEPNDERFEREARLLSLVSHPSVPRFEGSGSWRSPRGEAYPYVVMQWVEGMSLYTWAKEHGLTLRQAIEQLAQVARALEATHRHGVHRDVKGDNVRVSDTGHAVLLDFGSCWHQGARPLTIRAMPPITRPYCSPGLQLYELCLRLGVGEYYEAEAADDVYALGVTAYRLLADAYPTRTTDSEGKVKPLVAPDGLDDVCPELGRLIEQMLSEDPKARGIAKEVAEELERLLKQTRPALDLPWRANPSCQPTEKSSPPAPLEPMRAQPASRVAPAGCLFVAVLLGAVVTSTLGSSGVAFTRWGCNPKAAEKLDAGTKGLGEEAVASVAPAETPPVSEWRITREMPKEPLPGQKRPPCNHRLAKVINGGCWLRLDKPPCETSDYEHEGRCYTPALNTDQRVPTSEEPP